MKAKAEIRFGDGSTMRTTFEAAEMAAMVVQMDPASIVEIESVDRGGSTHPFWLRPGAVASVREL